MKRAYKAARVRYPKSLVFQRVGDYYEAFNGDAPLVAGALQMKATTRVIDEKVVPAVGIPCHQFDRRLGELLSHGYSVIVLDNSHDPKDPDNQLVVTRVEGL